jgi:hypothetical protein
LNITEIVDNKIVFLGEVRKLKGRCKNEYPAAKKLHRHYQKEGEHGFDIRAASFYCYNFHPYSSKYD